MHTSLALPAKNDIEDAQQVVYSAMRPTPQYTWPLLNRRAGLEIWLKHENHTPLGAFKIRGSLVYFQKLSEVRKVITATRGNHGQAVAFAAQRSGLEATIYVPFGNSASKNEAMRALGAHLVEFGADFQAAREEALRVADAEQLHFVPSFHTHLVTGVSTYSYELLTEVPDIDVVYVPIGLGSGICGMIAAREALGLRTEIVGVVSEHARAYYESFIRQTAVEEPVTTYLADGLACRVPEPSALGVIWDHVSRMVTVTDDELGSTMRILFEDTHNVAEGAGAAALAGVLKQREHLRGKRVAAVLSGGNVDIDVYARVLAGT
jgi:threonine dehydratase